MHCVLLSSSWRLEGTQDPTQASLLYPLSILSVSPTSGEPVCRRYNTHLWSCQHRDPWKQICHTCLPLSSVPIPSAQAASNTEGIYTYRSPHIQQERPSHATQTRETDSPARRHRISSVLRRTKQKGTTVEMYGYHTRVQVDTASWRELCIP